MRRLPVFEVFKTADALEQKEDKINFLRLHRNPSIIKLLDIIFSKSIKWHLPKGKPPINPLLSEGSDFRFYHDINKLYIYFDNGEQKAPVMDKAKRERLFTSMLMDLHLSDVDLLCQIKDKKWPYKTLTKELFLEAYPDITISS